MNTRPKFKICLDIGSTFSGYAYHIADQKKRKASAKYIKLNKLWIPVDGQPHNKTPTSILYEKNGGVYGIGFDAIENITNEERKCYFQSFKGPSKRHSGDIEHVSLFCFKLLISIKKIPTRVTITYFTLLPYRISRI